MTIAPEAVESFRRAWLDAESDDFASRMARRSLEALAQDNETLTKALFSLKNKSQSELDLHLEGGSVFGHETDAEPFANFIRAISDACKEVAKQALGRERRKSTLRILAPAPGSVHLVLKVPAPAENGVQSEQVTRTPTADSRSLDMIARVLARSEKASETAQADDVLSGLTALLPAKAHIALRRAAEVIGSQNWDIEGQLRSVDGFSDVSVTSAGAARLLAVLTERVETESKTELIGVIDGHRRSRESLWFSTDSHSSFEAAVPDPELFESVAAAAASNSPVRAVFEVLTVTGGGKNPTERKIYRLVKMTPATDGNVTMF
ncbi:hypothetical protein [Mycetocola lacteus]|uniref:hypothetical protein n=1 Tax=Mycetocola lacteus TaxID=76637 RepID=UPI0011C49792|nr:hypothetical protein [Mycetocola lacteus]